LPSSQSGVALEPSIGGAAGGNVRLGSFAANAGLLAAFTDAGLCDLAKPSARGGVPPPPQQQQPAAAAAAAGAAAAAVTANGVFVGAGGSTAAACSPLLAPPIVQAGSTAATAEVAAVGGA
jgi:hypothetical protein